MRLSFRWKLLLAFGATTVVAVAVVAFVATRLVRASFLRSDRERIEGVLGQAQASIQRRGELAGRRVRAASESEAATRMAIALNQLPRGTPAPGVFLTEAATLARAHELDLLQLIAEDGTILSSAQWQARAGYREPGLERLARYGWPGNVRELRNVVERALILARGGEITGPGWTSCSALRPPPPVEPPANLVFAVARSRKPWNRLSGRWCWRRWSTTATRSRQPPAPWAWSAAIFTRNAGSSALTSALSGRSETGARKRCSTLPRAFQRISLFSCTPSF